MSGIQRLGLALALLALALASSYSSLAVFARVYPALFPGQTLGDALGVTRGLAPIPGLNSISVLNTESSFNDRINLLVIGVDRRPQFTEYEGYLTDVVMVASLDPVTKKVSVLSFPRDLWIDIHLASFVDEDRINASYGIGFRAGNGFSDGANQLKKDLLANFGVKIDYWVLLDFKGVEKLVNAVGGVDIDIPEELAVWQWYYSDDDVNAQWLSFPPGQQHLDGYQAVAFGRHREYDSDLSRVKRQQLVLQGAISALFARGLLNNPVALWDAYSSTVKTDLSKARMVGLAPLVRQTQGRTSMYSVADPVDGQQTVFPTTTNGGASVLLWDEENVRYWVNQAMPPIEYVGSSVEIQDAHGGDEGARAIALARYLLFHQHLPTVYLGPDQPVQSQTQVTLYGTREALLQDVSRWLAIPPERVRREPRPEGSSLPDIVIVIGSDFEIPWQ